MFEISIPLKSPRKFVTIEVEQLHLQTDQGTCSAMPHDNLLIIAKSGILSGNMLFYR